MICNFVWIVIYSIIFRYVLILIFKKDEVSKLSAHASATNGESGGSKDIIYPKFQLLLPQ